MDIAHQYQTPSPVLKTMTSNQDRIHHFFRRVTGRVDNTYSYGSIDSSNRAFAVAIILGIGALLIPLAFLGGSAQLDRCQKLYGENASVRYRRYIAECYDGDGGIAPL